MPACVSMEPAPSDGPGRRAELTPAATATTAPSKRPTTSDFEASATTCPTSSTTPNYLATTTPPHPRSSPRQRAGWTPLWRDGHHGNPHGVLLYSGGRSRPSASWVWSPTVKHRSRLKNMQESIVPGISTPRSWTASSPAPTMSPSRPPRPVPSGRDCSRDELRAAMWAPCSTPRLARAHRVVILPDRGDRYLSPRTSAPSVPSAAVTRPRLTGIDESPVHGPGHGGAHRYRARGGRTYAAGFPLMACSISSSLAQGVGLLMKPAAQVRTSEDLLAVPLDRITGMSVLIS